VSRFSFQNLDYSDSYIPTPKNTPMDVPPATTAACSLVLKICYHYLGSTLMVNCLVV
jgi:hypothetical protein